jgi:hypothetical protein
MGFAMAVVTQTGIRFGGVYHTEAEATKAAEAVTRGDTLAAIIPCKFFGTQPLRLHLTKEDSPCSS